MPDLLIRFVVAVLLALAGFAGFSLWSRGRKAAAEEKAAPPAWPGTRELKVTRRTVEDRAGTQVSFLLEPVDGVPLPSFLPGQFLTFALAIPDAQGIPRTISRCYSLSAGPDMRLYRITVKRAVPPPSQPDVAPGVASNFLHDHVPEGTVLSVRAPAGVFVLDPDDTVPTALIAGGVGITPLLCMLKTGVVAHPQRAFHLFYGVRHGGEHAFRAELDALVANHPNVRVTVVYQDPGADDVVGRDCAATGFISMDLLRRSLPEGRHRFYVCGPPPMMASVLPGLKAWGVPDADVHHEAFGPASGPSPAHQRSPGVRLAQPVNVRFKKAGRTLVWDGADTNLLDFAERHGLAPESGCRSGSCGACEVKLLSGEIAYTEPPDHKIKTGRCLLCIGTPKGEIEVDA